MEYETMNAMEFVLHIIERRGWKNGCLKELAHEALEGVIAWELIDLNKKQLDQLMAEMGIIDD